MKKAQRLLRFSFALLLVSISINPADHAVAQALAAGTINGSVVDPNGAVVPNATVTIANAITGYQRTATTDADGNFRFTDVPPNNYQLTVSATGFSANTQTLTVRTAVPINLK